MTRDDAAVSARRRTLEGARGASPARRVTGALRIAAGLTVLAAIVTQVVDQLANDAFEPEEYFSYFTIQSSLINVVVLLVGGVWALRRARETTLLASVQHAIVPYAIVTALVYNLLLRGLPPEGFQGIRWPNEVMHVWIPIVIALDWLLAPGRPGVPWRAVWIAVGYPLAWLAFTMVRGAVDGWYPYPFLEPSNPAGIPGIVGYCVGIAALVVSLSALAIWLSRRRAHVREPAE